MRFGSNQNEGFKFEDSNSNMLLQLDGGNNTSGNGALSATFAGAITASGYNDSNWNTAYSWGNHASSGYLTSSTGFPKGTDIGGSVNLNNYTTSGYFHQNANSNATSGSNYPANVAGMLTVTNDGVMVYQSYQGYGANSTWERKYYNGTWEDWHKQWDSGEFANNSGNWNTAYGWGNHASAGYLTSLPSHNHAASAITSGNLAAARNTANLVDVGGSLDAQGIYFRGTTEVISGEGWCTAQYAYNYNDGFLFLNRNAQNTAFPTFHIGGWNNAGHAGYTDADGMITLTRSDGSKQASGTYAGTGLSNTSYWTRMVKTTAKTIFKDAQGKHEFDGSADFIVNASSTIALTSAGTNASQIKAGAGDELYLGGNNNWQMRLSGGNILMDNGGYALSNGSMRAPIFYASDDTAYYMDANGRSHLSKISGVRINKAASEGWQETDAWNAGTQTGYFGGDFTYNGSTDENNIAYEDMPNPNGSAVNKKGLVWKVRTNSTDSGADGGWNKTIGNIVYFIFIKCSVISQINSSRTVYTGIGYF